MIENLITTQSLSVTAMHAFVFSLVAGAFYVLAHVIITKMRKTDEFLALEQRKVKLLREQNALMQDQLAIEKAKAGIEDIPNPIPAGTGRMADYYTKMKENE